MGFSCINISSGIADLPERNTQFFSHNDLFERTCWHTDILGVCSNEPTRDKGVLWPFSVVLVIVMFVFFGMIKCLYQKPCHKLDTGYIS